LHVFGCGMEQRLLPMYSPASSSTGPVDFWPQDTRGSKRGPRRSWSHSSATKAIKRTVGDILDD
jgi:hypothetical protein